MGLANELVRRSEVLPGEGSLPDRYGVDLGPSPGGAIYGAPAGSASVHSELGFGVGAMEMQHAVRAAPLDSVHGAGEGFAEAYAVGPRVSGIYDGGGWPEHPTGSYRGPLRAARARPIAQELGSRDDYGRGGSTVDDLGRPDPGPLRNVTRGEYGD